MALSCVNGVTECTGCGLCRMARALMVCAVCEQPICEGDYYYALLDEAICEDCMGRARLTAVWGH